MAELADEPTDVDIVSSEVVFEGAVWDVRRDRFAYGDGELTREYVAHTGAVGVLAMDDEGRVLLIRQYRHPIALRDWEIPAGLLDEEGENPLRAAQRELAEEADLAAEEWSLLSDVATTPGGNDEFVRIYLARGLSATEPFDRAEEEADIETRWVPLEEAVDAVLGHRLHNVLLGHAVLSAFAVRSRGFETLGEADVPWPARERVMARR